MDATKVAVDAGGTAVGIYLFTEGVGIIKSGEPIVGLFVLLIGLGVLALETVELDRL